MIDTAPKRLADSMIDGDESDSQYIETIRKRCSYGSATFAVIVVSFAVVDPWIAPHSLLLLWGLKVLLLAISGWCWQRAIHARTLAETRMPIFVLLISFSVVQTLSTWAVGAPWHGFLMAGSIALAVAAFIPWRIQDQIAASLLVLAFALVPLIGAERQPAFLVPILNAIASATASVYFCWLNQRHRLETRRSVRSFLSNLERLQLLTENLNGVLWLSDSRGMPIYVSGRLRDIWGVEPDSLSRSPEAWLDRVHPDDRPGVEKWSRSRDPQPAACEYRLRQPNGSIRWIRDTMFPILGAEGTVWRRGRLSLDVTSEKDALAADRMRELARTIQGAVEEERKRMARELHDELGQILTGIKLFLSMGRSGGEPSSPLAAQHVDVCLLEIDKAMVSIRAMIETLRPPVLDDLGLSAALRKQVEGFSRRTGITCRLDLPEDELTLSDEEVTTLFRIAQEALTNVARHARASEVDVRLGLSHEGVCLCIQDNGQGLSPGRENFGLRGMRERAALLNGSLTVGPAEDRGTLIRLELPRGGGSVPLGATAQLALVAP